MARREPSKRLQVGQVDSLRLAGEDFLSPQDAAAYNGQQGDMWDAHKDMSLAMFGALLGLAFTRDKLPPQGR